MPDEKDRLGDKLRDVQRAREDRYFAEQDKALLEKLKSATSEEQEARLKEYARMRCPKCVVPLRHIEHLGVTLEECPQCQGIFLDRGELEQLQERGSSGWLSRFLGR